MARRPSRAEVREARLELGFSIPVWDEEAREERMNEEEPLLALQRDSEAREERSWQE